ncbi:MAG: DUF6079 family protein [Turicibacter sp.]
MLQYSELINFEPVESVVQLKDANDLQRAQHLLDTYVISDNMAEKICHDIIENIQFDRQVDNKGMLIVGNYGTGKSHLMSVISTIAEMPGASKYLKNTEVADKAKEIEGKFKVIRAEFGAVTKSLRDIICSELERGLENIGVDFTFPAAHEVNNNKDMLFEMMELFNEQYPDQGLLLVIDELLDYLRGRKDQDLVLDLGFLREIGEVCMNSRFRFISGVQEMLFDNPKFSFVADSLRRVKERFREVRIVREDIAFVVSERLLKKDDQQKALIREHLNKFTKMYHGLSENMEMYVSMFPIHPDYLETFEKVNIAEKRVVLQTISQEIKKLLDKKVPEEGTGFISFDRYWSYIEADSSLRTVDSVKTVMGKVQTLKNVINTGVKLSYRQMADQLVNALAVYRLTTDDLKIPIGLSSESLRDKLFIFHPMLLEMGEDAEFLTTMIESVLNDVMKAASFQFLSFNKDNSQYFVDVDKATAVDDLIQNRGEELNGGSLDRYYFQVLKQATEVSDTPYIDGYKIWLHEIPWKARRVKRQGYLFFGAPNERSTAQPERDFYIYMLQPFEEPRFKDEQKEDEIFFRLVKKDEEFTRLLRLYAGASEMYHDTSTNRNLYKPKMDEYLRQLIKYLKDHFVDMFEVTYVGKRIHGGGHGGLFSMKKLDTLVELIDNIAEEPMATWFKTKYPDYPVFSRLEKTYLTKENLHTYVNDALGYLNGRRTNQGEALLVGLKLIDQRGNVSVRDSIYAQWILELLSKKAPGQVVNYNELIEIVYTVQGTEDFRLSKQFKLEPELVVVILGALIQNGDIVVTIGGNSYEAMNFSDFTRLKISELTEFNHLKRPSGMPVSTVQALFEMFNVLKVDFTNNSQIDQAIKQLITEVKNEIQKVVKMKNNIETKFQIWDGQLFDREEKAVYISKLNSLNEFLQGLTRYDTRAKMVNLKYDILRVEVERENLKLVQRLDSLQQKINELKITTDYLGKAKHIISPGKVWNEQLEEVLNNLNLALKANEDTSKEVTRLEKLKKEYMEFYFKLHQKYRLNASESRKKIDLMQDPRAKALRTLAEEVSLLPESVFKEWQQKFNNIQACYLLTMDELQHSPECRHCHFNSREQVSDVKILLVQQEKFLNQMLESWTERLLLELEDLKVQESINLLPLKQQKLIKEFISEKVFDLPISQDLINAINTVLKGICKEQIDLNQVLAVFGNGSPITVIEARKNFEILLRSLVGEHNQEQVRLEIKMNQKEV